MPSMLLTEISIRALKGSGKNEKFFDTKTPGFGIRVGLKSKTWVVMRGRNRELVTIGKYPDLSLANARSEAKRLLSSTPEVKAEAKTWSVARDEFLAKNYKGSTSRWPHLVALMLKKHFKAFEHRKIVGITDADIGAVLDTLKETPSTQLHVYRAVRTFLSWCTRPPRKYLVRSPMEGYEPPGTDRKGTRTLTDAELKAVWNASGSGSRIVVRLLILWGTRSQETTSLKRVWRVGDLLTIPGDSTKNGRDHTIPILPLARTILDDRPYFGDFYFPGRHSNEKPVTAGSLARMKAEIQAEIGTKDWNIRDIRRTFRSNMARLKVPRDVCEVLINHAPPVLDEIYDRYDRVEEKREALAKYEAFMVRLLAEA